MAALVKSDFGNSLGTFEKGMVGAIGLEQMFSDK